MPVVRWSRDKTHRRKGIQELDEVWRFVENVQFAMTRKEVVEVIRRQRRVCEVMHGGGNSEESFSRSAHLPSLFGRRLWPSSAPRLLPRLSTHLLVSTTSWSHCLGRPGLPLHPFVDGNTEVQAMAKAERVQSTGPEDLCKHSHVDPSVDTQGQPLPRTVPESSSLTVCRPDYASVLHTDLPLRQA